MKYTILMSALLAVALGVAPQVFLRGATAGPPDQFPLNPVREGPGAAFAVGEEEERPFYYSNGRKVYLGGTGLAVAKVKAGVDFAASGFRPSGLSPNDPLQDQLWSLKKAGLVVIDLSDRGPQGLSAAAGADEFEFALPIVEVVRRPVEGEERGRAGQSTRMIVMPTIFAGFDKGMTPEAVAAYVDSFGLKIAKQRSGNTYELALKEGRPTLGRILAAANQLYEKGKLEADSVRFSMPNFVPTKRSHQPNIEDDLYDRQWHLESDGGSNGVADSDIDAEGAWRITSGDPQIAIAIIDDSVQSDHPDLTDNFVYGRYYNALTGQEEADPSPRFWRQRHGTSCAGVAVARGNAIGGRGVAPDCSLVGIHFWDASVAQTADAFRFAAEGPGGGQPGAAVISCSWSWDPAFDAVRDAIEEVAEDGFDGRGVVVLFAAANDYGTVEGNQKFGQLDCVICVGATNWRDDHSLYSNHGPEVDVTAPSNDIDTPGALAIVTTDNTDEEDLKLPGRDYAGYASGAYTTTDVDTGFGGTSSATPLVAGICGLMRSINRELTARQVTVILEHTADRVRGEQRSADYDSTTGHDRYYGYGRVNARRAVSLAQAALTNGEAVWPDHVYQLEAVRAGSQVNLEWRNPPNDVEGVLVLRSDDPIHFRPHDGDRFQPGDRIANGAVLVLATENAEQFTDSIGSAGACYAVFAFNHDHKYSWGTTSEVAPSLAPAGPVVAAAGSSE